MLGLTSAKSVKCIWTAGLAPAQHPPASRLACTPSSLDLAPGRPAPLAGPAGQLASAAPGAKAGGSCPAGCPGMWGSPGLLSCLCGLHCVFLTRALSAPLSEFGAVCESASRCLITLGLSRSAFLSVCLSVQSLGSHPSLATDAQCCLERLSVSVHGRAPRHLWTGCWPSCTARPPPQLAAESAGKPLHLPPHLTLLHCCPSAGAQPLPPHTPTAQILSLRMKIPCQFSHIPGRGKMGPDSSKSLARFIKKL